MTPAETAATPGPDAPEAPVPAPDAARPADPPAADAALVEADLLVEDVSIDGMCGVY
jgi:mycofactocin precursor